MPVHELSSREIETRLHGLPGWGGVVDQTSMPKLAGKCWVVLMANRATPMDGHWVLVYDCLPTQCKYFDSMGEPPSRQVERAMRATGKQLVFSNVDEQALRQVSCGYFCVYVARRLAQGIPFAQILERELRPLQFKSNQKLVTKPDPANNAMPSTALRRLAADALRRPIRPVPFIGGGTITTHIKHRETRRSKVTGGQVRCGGRTAAGVRCKRNGHCPHHG